MADQRHDAKHYSDTGETLPYAHLPESTDVSSEVLGGALRLAAYRTRTEDGGAPTQGAGRLLNSAMHRPEERV